MQIISPGGGFNGTLASGQFLAPTGSTAAPSYSFTAEAGLGIYRAGPATLAVGLLGSVPYSWGNGPFAVASTGSLNWSSTGSALGATDLRLARAGAGILRIGATGANPGGISSVANSPAALTANTNDYSPGTGFMQRWSATGPVNVTGMVASVDGDKRFIWNVGTQTIVLTHQDALSAVGNRWFSTTALNISLTANRVAVAVYDLASTCWRVSLLP